MIRPTKSQVIQIVAFQAPQCLEVFRDFQAFDKGWLHWPQKFIQIRNNLKLDFYVKAYEDGKRIEGSFMLFLMGKEGFSEYNSELEKLTPEEQAQHVVELTEELLDEDLFELELPNLFPTPEEQAALELEFAALNDEEKKESLERTLFFFQYLFASLHNYFSIMVYGEALTSLVPKALKGDDQAFCAAVNIDRHILKAHPYFIERYEKAQLEGHREFLELLSRSISTPALIGKIQYPGLYVVFAMLESLGWLDDLTHSEILDICDLAGLDRWQNRIEDVNYLTKRLGNYRKNQRKLGLSMQ